MSRGGRNRLDVSFVVHSPVVPRDRILVLRSVSDNNAEDILDLRDPDPIDSFGIEIGKLASFLAVAVAPRKNRERTPMLGHRPCMCELELYIDIISLIDA